MRPALAVSGAARKHLAAAIASLVIALLPASLFALEPPVPADTGRYLVGAQMCPLWNDEKQWKAIKPYPERMPLLGWYDEGDPAVTDWEVKWALEHGISFFLVCWYRAKDNLGQRPIRVLYEHWLRGLSKSRHGTQLKFAIQWENANSIASGAASADDLLNNLLPYWIESFFRQPNYLMDDGSPVLAIYDMKKFVSELGGEGEAAAVLKKMRQSCRNAGFKGLTVLGQQCWGAPEIPVERMKAVGADYTFPYHLPTFEGLSGADHSPAALMLAQENAWRKPLAVPRIVTVSVGWDAAPWGNMFSKLRWKLTAEQFKELCVRAKATIDERRGTGLESRMILIDAWNEYGEGHYIFPTKKDRFEYLDAIRDVFSVNPKAHIDPVP